MLGLHPQIPRHFEWQSTERFWQTFRHSYASKLISSYCVSSRVLDNGFSVCKITLIVTHTILRTLLDYNFRLTNFACIWRRGFCGIIPDTQVLRLGVLGWKSKENFGFFSDDVRQWHPEYKCYFTETFQFTNLAEVCVSLTHTIPLYYSVTLLFITTHWQNATCLLRFLSCFILRTCTRNCQNLIGLASDSNSLCIKINFQRNE